MPYFIWAPAARAELRGIPKPHARQILLALTSYAEANQGDVAALHGKPTGRLRLRIGDLPKGGPRDVPSPKGGQSRRCISRKVTDLLVLRSLKPRPLVDAGAHPLGMLMCLVTVQAEARRLRAAQN
jgi:hypothetical protein